MRIPVARAGWPFILPPLALSLVSLPLGWAIPAAGFGLLGLFLLSFFRDPERRGAASPEEILSPADGTILLVEPSEADASIGSPATKVSIFMSVFNCHVNRAPMSGTIVSAEHRPGTKRAAFADKASTENERNRVELQDGPRRLVFTQIAGALARRIVFYPRPGDFIVRGSRVGMIRFGSRVDIFLPPRTTIRVARGDKVKAGLTPLAHFGDHAP